MKKEDEELVEDRLEDLYVIYKELVLNANA